MPLQHDTQTFTHDNLFAALGVLPVVTGRIEIPTGQGKLSRGALLTVEGKLCGKSAASGEPTTQTVDEVYAVLADDVDATSAAVDAAVYFTGEFNQDALSFNTANSATLEDFRVSARKVQIYFRQNIG